MVGDVRRRIQPVVDGSSSDSTTGKPGSEVQSHSHSDPPVPIPSQGGPYPLVQGSAQTARRPIPEPRGPTSWFVHSRQRPWITYRAELNVSWWLLLGVAFLSRFWRLDFPRYVLFDEVHFGKFASYYLTRTFFFDVHPPLGKLIFAAVGYVNGFDGSFLFTTIGVEYPAAVPYVIMRSTSALAGVLLVPCVYEIMTELGFTHRAAILASIFTILDNSLVIQSRVIMLDSFLILFTYLSILCYLKFYHIRDRPFSHAWHTWLVCTGVALGCLLGVKYTGLLGLGCVGLLTLCDLWQLIGDPAINLLDLLLHTLLRGLYLLGIPMAMNLALFYIHLLILVQSGPGNAFVSKPFRNSLLQGTESAVVTEVSPNATLLRYGSHFSLRSSDLSCWLHSHEHLYPLKYPDGRGSSYQQQVTCYEFKDYNNLWHVRKPGLDPDNVSFENDTAPVRNKDVVELIHLGTTKLLNSHDVAAPLTPTHQEVATYINYSAQFVPYLRWRVEALGLQDGEPVYWEPGQLKLRLIHEHSKQAMASTGKRLPEWAFQQYEVVTDRAVEGSQTVWVMEELTMPNGTNRTAMLQEEAELKKAVKKRLKSEESDENDTMYFFEKYFELQYHMVTAHGNLGDHQFGAPPQNWPLIGKTLPYWLDETNNAQVTLIGNPLLWWFSTVAIGVFLALTVFYLLRRKRLNFDLSQGEHSTQPHTQDAFQHWCSSGGVLLVGWVVHYAPYFLLSRVLFLHHYLPALPCKFMLLAAVCEHAYVWIRSLPRPLHTLYYLLLLLLCVLVLTSFLVFAPFTYGYPALSREEIQWRLWKPSWDLLFR